MTSFLKFVHDPKGSIFVGFHLLNGVQQERDAHGGFILSRAPSQISLKEILEALEGDIFEVFCEPQMRERIVCEHFYSKCSVRPIWYRLRDLIDQFFQNITLEALLNGEPKVQQDLELFHFEPVNLNSLSQTG